jgi:hypothetical protein
MVIMPCDEKRDTRVVVGIPDKYLGTGRRRILGA